jgi:hypothetical protein
MGLGRGRIAYSGDTGKEAIRPLPAAASARQPCYCTAEHARRPADKETAMFRKPVRLTRLAASAIAVVSTAGALAFLGVGPASATVANNGNNRAYTNVDGTGCQVVVGDQADPVRRSAIGEVDVTRCSAYYDLIIRVYLDHQYHYANGTYSAAKTVAETQLPSTGYVYTYQLDAATNSVCGYANAQYTDYWYTAANISFNGGRTWSGLIYSYETPFETGC